MADYENLLDSIDAVIRSNNRREITGQILQNTLHQMVGSLGENYQLAGFATPTLDPNSPDQNVFYITDEAGVYTNFDNITLGAGLSFLMWKNEEWTSKTLDVVTADWLDEHYVSKAFLRKVFQFFDEDGVEIFPNDTESVVDNIKAMCGLWTNEYLSALGLGEGSTIPTTLAALNDVTITNPQDGQALVYDAASLHWVNATIQSGVDMSVVWAALAGSTNEQINISHLTSALSDYVTATSLATTLQSYVTTSALATELANYASQNWVETNYVSKAFFNSLFEAQDVNGNAITPNNSGQTTIDRLKILVGAYTEQYLSALGLSSGGGGGGSSTLAGLNDVTITNPQDGQALIYDAQSSHWVNGAAISMSAVWTALAAATSEQINSSHLTSALSGYVTTSALASELANYVTTSSLATTLADYVTTSALATTLADYGSKTWIDNNYVSKAFFNRLFQAFAPLAEGQTEPTQVEPNDTTTTIDNIKAMFGLWTEQYLSALGLSAGGGHTIGVLNDLNDVTISNPQTNQVLRYNGTQWVNDTAPSGASALSGLTDVAISSLADKDLLQWDYATGKWKNVVLSTAMSAYALASSIPTNVSQLNNDSGFITLSSVKGNLRAWDNNAMGWGTLTPANGYTIGVHASSSDGGDWGMAYKDGQIFMQLDGYYYQNEGKYRVADTSDLSNYLPLTGGTVFANDSENPLYIKSAHSNSYLGFKKSDGSNIGYLGVTSNSQPVFCDTQDRLIWTEGNDGSGSGLDADLLDGQHGSYYAAASSLSNYLPLSGGTITGALVVNRGTDDGILQSVVSGTKYNVIRNHNNGNVSISACGDGLYLGYENTTTIYCRGWNINIDSGNWSSYIGTASSYVGYASYATSAGSVAWANVTSHPTKLSQFTNDSGYVTSSGVTSVATGTGLTGGIITSTGTISISSTYQDYISHGESAYNSLSSYLPLSGGVMTGTISRNAGTYEVLRFAANDASWYSGLFYSYSSNTTVALYGKNTMTQFVWHAGVEPSITEINGTTNKTYDFQIGRDTSTGKAIVRVGGSCSIAPNNIIINNPNWSYFSVSRDTYGTSSIGGVDDGGVYFAHETSSAHIHMYLRAGDGLNVFGNVYATGGVTALSDIRHKTIVEDTSLQVSDIAKMRAVRYIWDDGREDKGIHVGSIAQDWQQILPEVVLRANNDEGTLSLQYGVAALISSITIARKVVNHEERITALEKENADLKQAYSFIKNAYDYLKMDYENLKLKIA